LASKQDAHHLEHRLASRCRGVETLLVEEEVDVQRMQLGEEADQVLQAAAEAIDAPGHDDVELPLGSIPAKPIKTL
jgi:hypothetical protein